MVLANPTYLGHNHDTWRVFTAYLLRTEALLECQQSARKEQHNSYVPLSLDI